MTLKEIIVGFYNTAFRYGTLYNVPSTLILAIIAKESAGNVLAKGITGDFGLMQITQPALSDFNNANGTKISLNDIWTNPEKNIMVGTWYISKQKDSSDKDWKKALQRYNAGRGTVAKNENASLAYADDVLNYETLIKGDLSNVVIS